MAEKKIAIKKDAAEHPVEQISGGEILGGAFRPGKTYKVKVYDFKRPDKFSKDQLRTVSIMHETFARLTTTSLSTALRWPVKMHVAFVDQMTYQEFIRSLPNPTTMGVVRMSPLKGSAILEIDPQPTQAIVDRVLGGEPGSLPGFGKDLTDIEVSLMENFYKRILKNLAESWKAVADLGPRLGQIETNPQFAQIVAPQEMVVNVGIEIKVGETEGMVNFCIPFITIEPLLSRLSARYFFSSMRRGAGEAVNVSATDLKVKGELYYEGTALSLEDIGQLRRNQLIQLPDYDKGRAFLEAGGQSVLRLTRKNGGRSPRFSVEGNDAAENDLSALFPGEGGQAGKSAREMAELITEPLDKIAGGFKESMRDLTRKVEDIGSRQDEIVDQMYFLSSDREVPQETGPPMKPGVDPFSFLRIDDRDFLVIYLANEYAQTAALVLSHLEPGLAASVLEGFSETVQPEIIRRIAAIQRTSPEVNQEVARLLEAKIKGLGPGEFTATGGIETVVDILNVASRSFEKNVVQTLEKSESALAEDIKKRMFVFEDIILLDDRAVARLLGKVDRNDLLKALKVADKQLSEKVRGCMEEEKVKPFNRDFQSLGPVRLRDVEHAQQRIIEVIRRMEEAGEIIVARPGELVE